MFPELSGWVAYLAVGAAVVAILFFLNRPAPLRADGFHTDEEKRGAEFLAAKATEAGVHKLASGMYFKYLTKGPGGKSPNLADQCSVHYKGTLISGKKFDSSYDRGQPLSFAPNQVIKGWTEALQLMREGDKWEVYIPYELAYGTSGAGGAIPGYAALVFEMELLKVKGTGKSGDEAIARLEKATGKSFADL